jgi:hypothetical protein
VREGGNCLGEERKCGAKMWRENAGGKAHRGCWITRTPPDDGGSAWALAGCGQEEAARDNAGDITDAMSHWSSQD